MANKTTYVLEIDAEISSLENKLKSMKGALAGVLSSAQAPKGLEKSFEKFESLLEKIRTKASQPLEGGAGFTSIKKDIAGAEVALNNVVRIIENIGSLSEDVRISFLSPETQKEVQTIVDSLADFAEAIATSTVETKELTEAREKLAKANASVAAAEQKITTLNADLDNARQQKKAADQAKAEIEERQKNLAELKKQQEEIEKFYNTPEADGSKKNRSKKYGDIMRPQDIRKKIADLEASMTGDEESLGRLQEEIKKTTGNIDSYLGRIGTAERELTEAKRSQEQLAAAVTTAQQAFDSGTIEQQQNAFKALREQASKLGIALDDIDENYSPENAAKLTNKFIELKNKGLDQVTDAANQFNQAAKGTGEVVEDLNKKIDESKESFEQLSEAAKEQDAFENKIKQFLGMAGAAQVLRNALRNAMGTIKELDATMTEMSVVTELGVGDYWDQLPQYTQRANELGLAINDVYKADTLFYQQGLKTNEVVAISTETMKMARIAGLDTAEATDRMTAALRGFNMELDKASAQKVSDVYSELAAITAADVEEISSAMTKTASIASSAGMGFETTAAFLSQIIETTRESAETAGTAMKTVIARFQELKKAPDEIGEIDGEIVDANAIEKALRSVGVSLRDAGGQFRELDDVFLELSSKWSSLDKNTQRYIATIAAGSRQQSRFIAMMSDYARTQELVTAANTSAGASQKQFEKTAESLQTKLNKLKNAWDEFAMGILESDLVKFGVDVLTKFLEIINSVTQGLDGFGSGLTKIFSILAIFKMGMKIFNKFKPAIMSLFGSIVKQAGLAGEESGKAYKQGLEKAKNGEIAEADTQEQKGSTKAGWNGKEMTGPLGTAANIGMKISGAVHAAAAADAYQKKKQAGATLGLYETTKDKKGQDQLTMVPKEDRQARMQEQRKKYDENKQKLKEKKEQYTFHDDGTASVKGKSGLLNKEEADKAKKEIDELTQATEEYENAQEEFAKNSKKQWDEINEGFSAASTGLIAIGVGFGMVGSALEDAGLDGAAEAFNNIASVTTTLGTVMGIIPPILTLIQTLFPGVGAAGAAAGGVASGAGIAASAAWSIVGIIVLAVVAAIAIALIAIIAIMALIENASPEKKLEEVEAAADRAAEAADRAAESYENLVNALDELDGKYEALEELTQGTKEWNEAIRDINNSVLDLIDEYPELAKFVENKSGVLTIDVDSDEVQGVLRQAEIKQVNAKNESTMANAAVLDAQNQVDFGKLDAIEKVASKRGWGTFGTATGVGAAIGAGGLGATGAVVGAGLGPVGSAVLGGVGALFGGAAGAVIGMITGAIAGPINAAATASDEQLQEAVEGLAESVSMGETEADYDSMYTYLTEKMGVAADEAKILAEEFSNDTSALIEYGNSVHAAEEQQKASYEAIASSAQSLANTMNMSAEQIQQSSNLVDGDLVEQYYKEEMAKFDGKDLKHINDSDEVNKAIREKYGASAELKDDGTVEYNGEDGRTSVKLTLEEIKSLVATSNATKRATTAIESSDEAIARVASTLGKQTGNESGAKSAIEAMYMANNGGALTKAELDILRAGYSNIDDIWESLSEEERLAYGNDKENLREDFEEAIKGASKVLEDETKVVFGYMTTDMAEGFNAKLDDVLNKAGGETAKNEVKTATEDLLKRKSEEQQQEIQALINATDWTNLESLKALQIELQSTYGYSREEAEAYIKTLGEAAYATSNLYTTVEAFGEFYQANQRVEDSLRRISELQQEYNNALEDGQVITEKMLSSMAQEYSNLANNYEERYNASTTNLSKIGARGHDTTQFGTYNLWDYVSVREDGSLDTSGGASGNSLQDLYNSGISDDLKEKIETWIEDYNTEWEAQQESLEGLKNAAEEIRELESQGKEAYYELRDMVKETILDKLQKQIDAQQDTLDATKTANTNLINKIQEQIDYTRQQEQNRKVEENIANLQSQAVYLGMDTSGGNALQQAQLQEQIEQAEEDYLNTRIDQSIQAIQDGNAKAEEQRERQILLAEQQLTAYQNSPEFQSKTDEMLDQLQSAENWRETTFGELMYQKFTEGLSSGESGDWQDDISNKIKLANGWEEGTFADAFASLQLKIDNLPTNLANAITNGADTASLNNQVTDLQSKGVSAETLSSLGMTVERDAQGNLSIQGTGEGGTVTAGQRDQLDKVSQYLTTRDSGGTTADSIAYLNQKRASYQNEEDYYAENIEKIASGEKVATYEEYLQEEAKSYRAGDALNKAINLANSSGAGLRGMDSLLEDSTFQKHLSDYKAYGGDEAEFKKQVSEKITSGAVNSVTCSEVDSKNYDGVWYTTVDISADDMPVTRACIAAKGANPIDQWKKDAIKDLVGDSPEKGWMCMLYGEPYVYWDDDWRAFDNNPDSKGPSMDYKTAEAKTHLTERYLNRLRKYKTGGVADFTGPAWLDGTPSKPEYVLNSAQTERFFSLIDVLEKYDTDESKQKSGDNYFDIEINVEKLDNDYDVEKLADKIRSMIYNDATYRNVNAINHIR